jgi:hypothetical protein
MKEVWVHPQTGFTDGMIAVLANTGEEVRVRIDKDEGHGDGDEINVLGRETEGLRNIVGVGPLRSPVPEPARPLLSVRASGSRCGSRLGCSPGTERMGGMGRVSVKRLRATTVLWWWDPRSWGWMRRRRQKGVYAETFSHEAQYGPLEVRWHASARRD